MCNFAAPYLFVCFALHSSYLSPPILHSLFDIESSLPMVPRTRWPLPRWLRDSHSIYDFSCLTLSLIVNGRVLRQSISTRDYIGDVGSRGKMFWFYSNHPIRWVRVVGVVVAYDDMEKMVSITGKSSPYFPFVSIHCVLT